MPGEGGASCECLLTVGVGASVRPLAGVNPPVPGQRAGVAKRLAAALTHMRLLASVDTLVHSKCRPLDKLLSTCVALVGAVSAVDAF